MRGAMLLLEKCSYLVSAENLKLRNVSSSAARPLIVRKARKPIVFSHSPVNHEFVPFKVLAIKNSWRDREQVILKTREKSVLIFTL